MSSHRMNNNQPQSGSWYYDSAPVPSGGNGGPLLNDDGKQLRGQIRESDSNYVKLSKQGGRKDLLQFGDPEPVEKTPTKPQNSRFEHQKKTPEEGQKNLAKPDWKAPDYMVHDEGASPNGSKPSDQDGGKNWAQQERENNQRKYNHRAPPFYTTDYDPAKEGNRTQYGKKTFGKPADKEVNFSKLMGGGYGDDWHTERGSTTNTAQEGQQQEQ